MADFADQLSDTFAQAELSIALRGRGAFRRFRDVLHERHLELVGPWRAYEQARGDPSRWPGPAQLYRASGLSPMQYESAGKRRDGAISREGSVPLRRAPIDLGIDLWLNDPTAKTYAAALRGRGKKGAIIACAMAHRANRIAYALVRDHVDYDPARWG